MGVLRPIMSTPLKRRIDTKLKVWATEVFRATGNRRHVIGIFASSFNIRFYFYDRAGIIYTEALQIQNTEDAVDFVSAVISLSLVSPFNLGMEPFFAPSPRLPHHHPAFRPPPRFFNSWTDLSNAEGAIIQVDGVDFIIEDLIMSSGAIHGRGTTVFGVRPAPTVSSVSSDPLLLRKSARQADIRSRCPHSSLPQTLPPLDGRLILKLAWQVPSRQSEDALLRLAQEKGVEGVIKPYKSATLERLSKGFRGKLVPKKMYVDRELRVQILGPRSIPLKRVVDIQVFKEAFRSLVQGGFLSKLATLAPN